MRSARRDTRFKMAKVVKKEDQFEVEKVLDQRKRGRFYEYLIRWKGLGEEDDTWEPVRHLKNSMEEVDKYLASIESPKGRGRRSRRSGSRSRSSSRSRSTSRGRKQADKAGGATGKTTRGRMKTSARISQSNTTAPVEETREVEKKQSLPVSSQFDSDDDVAAETIVEKRRVTRSTTTVVDGNNITTTESVTVTDSNNSNSNESVPRFLQLSCKSIPVIIVITSLIALFISYYFYYYQNQSFKLKHKQ
ncbi:uncharacterized protein LOC141901849 [Tubulanus polymorphus]|uniref:uncharacterized protein LOC141901849 n=1 Tax=Tubulanus polymorphus TaxID=672921 RepID=UPI003DA47BF7